MIRKYMWPVLLCLLISAEGHAQEMTTRLDSFYKTIAAKNMLNGNVLVAQQGKIVYQQSFGNADFEQKRVNDAGTGFQLASLSKVFTGIAILQLYEKGKIKLDEPFSHYFPAFPYQEITIRQLLSHSSGLSDQDLDSALTDFEKKNNRRPNNNDLVPLIAGAGVKLTLPPGQKWWYCNLGFELLATLVEKVSGITYEHYLAQHILKPAGMKDTYLKMPGIPASANTANNYDHVPRYAPTKVRVDKERDYMQMAYGHSNIVSTTGDLFKLDQALYQQHLLKQSTMDLAFSPAKWKDGADNVVWANIGGMGQSLDGLAWFTFKDQSMGKIVWHAGGKLGAVTILLRDLDRQQTVILLDNTGSEGLYKTALNTLKILNGQPLVPNKKNLSRIYVRAMMEAGADHAMAVLQTLKTDTSGYNLKEDDMNELGYALLAGKEQA